MKVGDKYHRLVALEPSDADKWWFLCECGSRKLIRWRNVERGQSRSCGCLHAERTSAAKTTHGHSRGGKITPEFQAYRSMMARCYRPSNNRFEKYGGRGIAVCDRWRDNFEAFLADMGSRPSPQHSLDRRDNDGPYDPGNCRWATRSQQMRNRSNCLPVTVGGETMTLIEASQRFGIPYTTLKARIFKFGWPHERAVSLPVRQYT